MVTRIELSLILLKKLISFDLISHNSKEKRHEIDTPSDIKVNIQNVLKLSQLHALKILKNII